MVITASQVVAAGSGEAAKSGPIGFAVVLVLAVACYFLFKSMSKHMRTVREHFPTEAPKPSAPVAPAARIEAKAVKLVKDDAAGEPPPVPPSPAP